MKLGFWIISAFLWLHQISHAFPADSARSHAVIGASAFQDYRAA
jgi:hypothetical protein